jgi:hypothetical protein
MADRPFAVMSITVCSKSTPSGTPPCHKDVNGKTRSRSSAAGCGDIIAESAAGLDRAVVSWRGNPTPPGRMAMPVFERPEAEIHYEVHGSGHPLLLF